MYVSLRGQAIPILSVVNRTRLFVFVTLFHDPRSGLAGVLGLALVRIELLLNGTLGITELAETTGVCGKLSVAIFADSKHWHILDSLYYPEIASGQGAGFLLNAIH
jgi:uncharacterized membrane protein YdcZ (DUF606 family)